MTTKFGTNDATTVSYGFFWIRKTCHYISLNVRYCVRFSNRVGLGLALGLDLVSVRLMAMRMYL